MDGHIVYKRCGSCKGTGVNLKFDDDPSGSGDFIEDDCPICDGNKYVLWGWLTKDDATLPDYIPENE